MKPSSSPFLSIAFSAVWLGFVSSAACAQDTTGRIRVDGTEVRYVVPQGFKLGHRDQQGATAILEYVPADETITAWSRLFTILVSAKADVQLAPFREMVAGGVLRDCLTTGVRRNGRSENRKGLQTLEFLVGCEKLNAGPSQGKAEYNVYRLAATRTIVVSATLASRHALTTAEREQALRILRRTTLTPG
jgi:hypothetical protein